MKKSFLIFVYLLSFPLFSEQIHFRLINNQNNYDFINNSEFYFDTQTDTFGVYNNYNFESPSIKLYTNSGIKRISFSDIELFNSNDKLPDSIKSSIWTLKYYFDDVYFNKNTLFKNETFWKNTWDSIESLSDYDEKGKDYFAPVTIKIFDAGIFINPNNVYGISNIIFNSIKNNGASILIEGWNVDKYFEAGYPFIYEYFPYKSKIIYELVLDGDYLYFYHNDSLMLSFVRTNIEMQYEITNYYTNNKCDKSKFTWPRHADGTCDYENRKTLVAPSSSATNVSVSKVMSVKENLRLRSAEATSSNVMKVMASGTKVKVLELGKEETIDGIKSNWVKVEIISGNDRDGNKLKSGITGWCYGGYLE